MHRGAEGERHSIRLVCFTKILCQRARYVREACFQGEGGAISLFAKPLHCAGDALEQFDIRDAGPLRVLEPSDKPVEAASSPVDLFCGFDEQRAHRVHDAVEFFGLHPGRAKRLAKLQQRPASFLCRCTCDPQRGRYRFREFEQIFLRRAKRIGGLRSPPIKRADGFQGDPVAIGESK